MPGVKEVLDKLDLLLSRSKVGEWKQAIIAKDGTVSDDVDLGGHFAYLQVEIPTLDSAALELQVCPEAKGSFQDLGQDATTIAGTGGFSDTWNLGGWRLIRIKASAAQTTAARIFRIRGVTY